MAQWVWSSTTLPLATWKYKGTAQSPGHREDVKQLLEVGPMVLVVAPGDGHPRRLAPLFFLSGIGIDAVEGDCGGVVVQLIQVDLELADHMRRHTRPAR